MMKKLEKGDGRLAKGMLIYHKSLVEKAKNHTNNGKAKKGGYNKSLYYDINQIDTMKVSI